MLLNLLMNEAVAPKHVLNIQLPHFYLIDDFKSLF